MTHPASQLIAVNGRTIEYVIKGEARPVIVFLNGAGPVDMDEWTDVLDGLGGLGTLVAYNRFGQGRSQRVSDRQTGPNIVATLRRLLLQLGLGPPYILVGHSLGGLFANLFARRYPDEIAAVVLVDSSHPDQGRLMRKAFWGVLTRLAMDFYRLTNRAKQSELAWAENCAADFKASGRFPDVPLIVVSAGKRVRNLAPDAVDAIERYQKDLASSSPQGRQVIAKDSTHMVPTEAPEIVIAAIRDVVAEAEQRRAGSNAEKDSSADK